MGLERGTGLDRTKRMRNETPKHRRRRLARADLRAETITAGLTDCVIRWEGVCTGTFDGWHHLHKLSHGGSDDPSNMIRACNPCNSAVEDHPTEARQRGWVKQESE